MNKEKVAEIITETVETMQFIPVEIHIDQNRQKQTVKVVIYHKDKDIGTDDCARISNIISRRLDVEDLIESAYNLVVESPGVERKLIHKKEYSIFEGQEVAVYLNQPNSYGIKGDFLKGILGGLSENKDSIYVESQGKNIKLSFEEFNRCNLYFDIKKYLKSGGR